MKRSREDVNMNPQIKRPLITTQRESYAQPQVPAVNGGTGAGGPIGGSGGGGNTPKLTTNDALSYLKEVKEMFPDKKENYDMFLDIMKDFKAQRTDTAGVIGRVKELFKGHPNLILGFNTFLPKGYEITLNNEEEARQKKTVEFEEAISFVTKIKKRFQNDDRVYKSFLDILNMYRKDHKGITEVYQEVEALFEDHPDLLEEFTKFLPDPTASAPQASSGRRYERNDERSSAMPSLRPAQMDKPHFRRDRISSPHGERDFSAERLDTDDDKTAAMLQKEPKKRSERDNREKINHDQDFRESENENNGDIRNRLADKRKSTRKAEELGGDAASVSFDDKDALKSMYSQEFCFCDKVKERLNNDDDYQAFLKCLHIYSTEIITRKELQGLVADLLGKYPDLMEGFNEVLERCEKIDGFLGVMSKKSLWNEGHSSKPLKSEDKEKEQKRDVEVSKDKDRYKEKYWVKSIQELDLSNCERCTPSYRLLPEDYPIPSVSQRSELGEQVFNDHWVSVTSGSEDYSFKHMRRNQYEESLFRCEDDRFELDMLLESVSSTAKRVEEFLNATTNDKSAAADSQPRIEDHLSALNLRCIERMYGDHGLDVMDILRKNPSVALPVVLIRLKQKQEEWSRCRADFNKVWSEIYYKNHYKSLDHRSFYFKQQDSKNLSTKFLVAEIKEIKEKMVKEDDVILSVAAGSRRPIVPNLEFEYADVEIHEDMYKLIKYSSEEVCSTEEQVYKVMRLWTTFLEPMLGVPSRSYGSEITEDGLSTKSHVHRGNGSNIIECEGILSADATLATNFKQSKAICNGNTNSSLQILHSSRSNLTNIGARLKENAISCGDQLTSSDAVPVTDGISSGNGVISLRPTSHIGSMVEGHVAKSNAVDMPSSGAGDASRTIPLANGVSAEVLLVNGHDKDSCKPSKIEKEEGELSPNCDSEEDNFGAYQDGGRQSNTNNENHLLQFQNDRGEEASADNDADADDEDSENVSEVGEDISGSESAADECSREENEEEEDAEHDGHDAKGESEGEVEGISETHFVGGDGTSLPVSERFLLISKPIAKHIASSYGGNEKQHSRIFYGNDSFYVLFRLHQILYERLLSAKQNSTLSDVKRRNAKDVGSDPYSRFLSALYGLLDGNADNAKFEDDCRTIIGNQSYVLFTLDKLIYKLVKQLQAISSDELDNRLLQLYEYEKSRKPENFVDSVYYENSHVLLYEENIYRFESKSSSSLLSIQLMDDGSDKSDVVAVSVDPNFATYLHDDYLSVGLVKNESSAVMLKRNKRKFLGPDEDSAICMALKNVKLWNGLECKMASTSSKIFYVLDTEDYFFRRGRKTEITAQYKDFDRSRVAKFTQHWKAVLQSRG